MSKNPKKMIALAFVLTFLIGVGAGYLIRGAVQVSPFDSGFMSQDELPRGWSSENGGQWNQAAPGDRQSSLRSESRNESGWRQREYPDRPFAGRDRTADSRDPDDRRYRSQEADNRERPDFGRIREKLREELQLSDVSAEAFFRILENHRNQVKEDVVLQHRAIREHYQELGKQLEEELAEVLTPEQMELWQEKFAPRMERHRRSRENGR